MKIAFYGSSLLSSHWNGTATYYRGLLADLARRGHAITFYEPDAFDRQVHRDMDPPPWATVKVFVATEESVRAACEDAAAADVVVKASGVGVFDDELVAGLLAAVRPGAISIFWDVDAPATLAELQGFASHPLRRALPRFDLVLTCGGGSPVVEAYRALGARRCVPIYHALDPSTHHPVAPDPRLSADLSFLGNRLPDREARLEEFFLKPAGRLLEKSFLLGGPGWESGCLPANVRHIGHVQAREHNAFNRSPLAVLSVARKSMAAVGFSPPTRFFEAAGAGACLITDAWEGIEQFLKPGEEVLVARDGIDVAEYLEELTPERASLIGRHAFARVLAEHTYVRRGGQVDAILREEAGRLRERSVA